MISKKDQMHVTDILNAEWYGTIGSNTDAPSITFGWEDSPQLTEVFKDYLIPIEKGQELYNEFVHQDEEMIYEPGSADSMRDTWNYYFIEDIQTVDEFPFPDLAKWANQSGYKIVILLEIRKDNDVANGYARITEVNVDADSEYRGSIVSKRSGIVETMFMDYDEFLNEVDYFDGELININEGFKDILQKVQDAIRKKEVCNIYYKGEISTSVLPGTRYIEPYAVGVSRDGNMIVRAWLIKGVSKTGKINPKLVPGWRIFKVNRIQKLDPTHQKFTTARKGYNPEDEHMEKIISVAKF